jgi:glycine/D-amino acid oxidase-like deaminating enzyme
MKRAEVVVIGGGVIGCALAYHLARRGARVALLEAGVAGAEGATRYSGGIVRSYDPDPVLADLSRLGHEQLLGWEVRGLPGPSPMRASGCLYLAAPEKTDHLAAYAASAPARESGVELIAPGDLQRCFSFLRAERPAVGLFEPRGGCADPRLTARNLVYGIQRHDGAVYEHCRAFGFDRQGSGAWAVKLETGAVACDVVVVACGAASRFLVPQLPMTVRSIPLTQIASSHADIRFPVIDEATGIYLRPIGRPGEFYCGTPAGGDHDRIDQLPGFGAEYAREALRGLGTLLRDGSSPPRAVGGLNGYDAYTSTKRPVAGFVDDGVYVVSGCSGRGYKYALALGEAGASEIANFLGRSAASALRETTDLRPFRPGRDEPAVCAGARGG